MQVKHDVVRIGDVIALADLEAGGYVVGDDVVGDSLYVEPEDAFMPPLSPHQLDTAQFVVVPRFQYSAHAQLSRLVHSAQIPGMDGGGAGATWGERLARVEVYIESLQSGDDDLDPLSDELRTRLRAYHDERETNEMELKRTTGRPVAYGNVIQLRHSRTGKFVTYTKRSSNTNQLKSYLRTCIMYSKGV